jgi:arylamine N-acetyltransferase
VPTVELLEEIAASFAAVPFENATQINRLYEEGPKPQAADLLITQHLIHGTGGICYALVNALDELLRMYGFRSDLHHGHVGEYPGRRYHQNHAALSVEIGPNRYLLDPGMMLTKPLLLDGGGPRVVTGLREVDMLVEKNPLEHLLVMTRSQRGFGHAFMIDLRPTTRFDFMRAWRAAFNPLLPADYLVVHKLVDGTLWSLRDQVLSSRDHASHTVHHGATWHEIADRFGIDAGLLERAWKRTKYAGVAYRVTNEIARAARTTFLFARSIGVFAANSEPFWRASPRTSAQSIKEAAVKRAA